MSVSRWQHSAMKRLHRRLVGADRHCLPNRLPELSYDRFRLVREPHDLHGALLQQLSRLGELAGPLVEQLLPQVALEFSNGLADGGLATEQLGRRAGEAPLVGDGQKDLQFPEVHCLGCLVVRCRHYATEGGLWNQVRNPAGLAQCRRSRPDAGAGHRAPRAPPAGRRDAHGFGSSGQYFW